MYQIALAQLNIHAGNPRRNVEAMKEAIAKAKEKQCDIIVFPELAIPGYLIGDIWDQADFINECTACGDEIRQLSQDIAIIYGNVAKEEGNINPDGRQRKYNAMFCAYNGTFVAPEHSPYPSTSRHCSPITGNSATSDILHPSWKSLWNGMLLQKTSYRQ